VAASADHTSELAHARRLLFDDRLGEAMTVVERMLAGEQSRHDRVAALILRLIALINMGRSAEFTIALDEAMEATRTAPDPGQYGELQALAAIVAVRAGSIDRAVRHLVWGARALNAVELTDYTTAWAWHNLAMAYSYSGFHGHATAAMERAREVAHEVGLKSASTDLAVPALRLRLAVDLDQRGDTEGCQRILRDIINDLERKDRDGEINNLRPVSRGAYGYAILRLGALGARGHLTDCSPTALLESAGDATRSRDFRTLGAVCQAIAERRPIEAIARLETATVVDDSLGAAEIHRLRALAHQMAGDYRSAYHADRHAFRVASAQIDRLRDLFVDGVAARLDHEDLRRSVDHFRGEAQTDPLTGLPNRRYLEQYVADLVAAGRPAVLGVCDLDGFKAVNTIHGHLSGDLVLQRVAGVLNRVMRKGDFVARYGGDEFVVVLPTTSVAEASEIARRILSAVAAEDWQELVPGTPVGVTIGWAGVSGEGAFGTVSEAFEAADHAMLRAKSPRPRAS
jgi:diguanylate cyclase (GGDEF)-like protein